MNKAIILSEMIESIKKSRNIPEENIIKALENSITEIVNKKYFDLNEDGFESDIIAKFNSSSGEVIYYRSFLVSEENNESNFLISKTDASIIHKDAKIGQSIYKFFPYVVLNNIEMKNATKRFYDEILNTEKQSEYEILTSLMENGTLIEAEVKKINPTSVILSLVSPILFKNGNQKDIELVMNIKNKMEQDNFRNGELIHCIISNVIRDNNKIQGQCSRTSSKFLEALMKKYIPEISYENISIVSIARDPGSKSKVAVSSSDQRIDAVGTCIGPGGSKIQSITKELGEKIDIIAYDPNILKFAENAVSSQKAVISSNIEEDGTIKIIVSDEMLGNVIGRSGQNIRLASQLIGVDITAVKESDAKEENKVQNTLAIQNLKNDLDIDDGIATLLLFFGYKNIEQIANASIDLLLKINGFDEEIATEIKDRAVSALTNKLISTKKKIENLKLDKEFINLVKNENEILILIENDIKTINDLADLSTYELLDISNLFATERAKELIMKARDLIYL